MTKCDYCGSTVIFGGKRDGNGYFCNDKCRGRGALLAVSRQLPAALIQEQVWKIHQGPCPKCSGAGPVDVHVAHKVWSALIVTSWSSTPQISCRSCGQKRQIADAGFSLFLGWWGFPWGLVMTPVQIARNLIGMSRGPDPAKPSAQLEKVVRMTVAAQAVQQQQASKAAAAKAH